MNHRIGWTRTPLVRFVVRLSAAFAFAVAGGAAMAVAEPAPTPDESLAASLAWAIESAPELDASARPALARAAADAARPLAPLAGDATARLGTDLASAIRAGAWPFAAPGRERTHEGRAWLEDSIRFAVRRAVRRAGASAEELHEARSIPSRALAAIRTFLDETRRDWPSEDREMILAGAKADLGRRAALFGNAFVPSLWPPCPQAGGAPPPDVGSTILEQLRIAPQLLLTTLSEESGLDPDAPDWRLIDARLQVMIALRAVEGLRRNCPDEPLDLPESLVEREMALIRRAGDVEESESARRAEEPLEEEMINDDGTLGSPSATRRSRAAVGLDHDAAMQRAFEGSGVVVVHGTPILPRSWVPRAGRSIDWRPPRAAR